jgi:hypothetical protein
LRDSAGFTPDFAGRAAARAGPGQPAKLPYWLITRLTRLTWSQAAGAVSGQLAARHPLTFVTPKSWIPALQVQPAERHPLTMAHGSASAICRRRVERSGGHLAGAGHEQKGTW